jgi:hypothetical protein
MRYRALTPSGDYTFGHGSLDFLVDSPAVVVQAISTALKLFQGEWFLDSGAGMPWSTQVLGYNTQALYDTAIKSKILSIQGVNSIVSYSSSLNRKTRLLTVKVTVETEIGEVALNAISLSLFGFGVGPFGEEGFGN